MIVFPLGDNIVLKEYSSPSQTPQGIHLLEAKEDFTEANRGEVMAVGPGRILSDGREVPLSVQVGDVVVYGNLVGSRIEVAGEEYLVISERGVLAIEDNVHPPQPDMLTKVA